MLHFDKYDKIYISLFLSLRFLQFPPYEIKEAKAIWSILWTLTNYANY